MDKKMTLRIGDKEVILNLGVNYFYKYFKEVTDIDLFANPYLDVMSIKLIEYTKGYIMAGHKAHCSVSWSSEVITLEELDHFLMSQDDAYISDRFMEISAMRAGMTLEAFKEEIKKKMEEETSAKSQV